MGHIPVAKPSPILRESKFPRRGLLIALLLVGVFAVDGVALASSWPSDSARPSEFALVHTIPAANLGIGEPIRPDEQKFWLVKTPDGSVIALASRDPRNGCTVPWRPEFVFDNHKGWFRDPCHGSTYDAYGHKVFGPSPRDMDRFDVKIANGDVYVDTSRVICSDGSSPCEVALPPPR